MSRISVLRATILATVAATALVLSGCSSTPAAEGGSDTGLDTVTAGKLTVATGDPGYFPWIIDNDPSNGKGLESAVAYAVAEKLGFAKEDVVWTRTSFESAIAPGPKDWDLNMQQYTATDERRNAVDFSTPYYTTGQAVVTTEGSAAEGATSLADLRDLRIGVTVGSTSYSAAEDIIKPAAGVSPFNTNEDAVMALKTGQIDAIVVDTPVAFYVVGDQLEDNGLIVGLLGGATDGDELSIVLPKKSPLTTPVSEALDALRADGTLEKIATEWMADAGNTPILK
ncbi:ABC transporter substrate-binding protein [Mycetocola spongiae]|uniref:ABC transporter substrate-binding protein n=1 Tax=Mycetocola spongiae TaxID=2859226 RepID=UPI001CF4EAEA|nr:transporter substrate-binding domain-containing protein [Mycetocola spongiae]UCR90081.1 ABC transporter substrate-binding protein [Mycetocola spongiae]